MKDLNVRGELEFPLNYVLKVIFSGSENENLHLTGLESLLDDLAIPRGNPSSRKSGRGGYVSISIPVTVKSRVIFDHLYKNLNVLPSVKCAI